MSSSALALAAPAVLGERSTAGLHESLLRRVPAELARDAAILDVGCGSGAWLARLHARGHTNLTGIDHDVAQAGFAGARILRGDLNRAGWAEGLGQFRLISVIEVIEHIENLGIFCEQLETLLASGGTILLTTPNVESLASRLRFLVHGEMKHFDRLGDPTHLFPMLTRTLPRILARHGLRIGEQWGYPDDGRTVSSRRWVNLACAALRRLLPEPVPGDNLCLRLQKA